MNGVSRTGPGDLGGTVTMVCEWILFRLELSKISLKS